MYVCLCNPFSDKKVDEHLKTRSGQKTSMSDVYGACSGGETPSCCQCLETIKGMVKNHNGSVTT